MSAATPAINARVAKVNGSVRSRYMPPNSNGRYLIEQHNEHWSSAVAATNIKAGQVIGTAPGVFHPHPTRWTVQADMNKHLEFKGGLEYVNHSCNPNARLVVSENTPEVAFVAIRDIKEGENLSFDYSTSEWNMDEKFDCRCGSPNCRGHIGGAKYLSDREVRGSLPYFTPSILRLLLSEKLGN
ncbi:TPA: hypothetical protein N0F65_008976 [Lagenidium giganteum]|uniref:Post-SET domain-containing protein n=1 Tax=Lagenidium giganteum TaxID=4803 RepID=A0AAV2YHL2_9STRA|nr:TPA: hypothetical protein N0F65_008976 [Lagenidium giganteum]